MAIPDRDPKIRLDVRDEYTSVERAKNVYGVVSIPHPLPTTLKRTVDHGATES
jgi:hypothetical protein